jgi:hypothetical protein
VHYSIDLADANKHPETVVQIEERLKQYRAELQQKGDTSAPQP